MAHTKTTLYPIIRPIVYNNPESAFAGHVIRPGDKEAEGGLNFPHLESEQIALLQRKRYLGKPIKKQKENPKPAQEK